MCFYIIIIPYSPEINPLRLLRLNPILLFLLGQFQGRQEIHIYDEPVVGTPNEVFRLTSESINTTPNEVYGQATDGMKTTPNEVYGLNLDGINTTPNEVYGLAIEQV